MADYQIFTDATADLSPEMLSGLPLEQAVFLTKFLKNGLKIIWICAPQLSSIGCSCAIPFMHPPPITDISETAAFHGNR